MYMSLTRVSALVALAAASGTVIFKLGGSSSPADAADTKSSSRDASSVFSSDEAIIERFLEARARGDAKGAIALCHPDFTFTSPRSTYRLGDAHEAFAKAFPPIKVRQKLSRKGSLWTQHASFSPVAFVTVRVRQTFELKRHNGRMKIVRVEHAKL